MNTDAIKQAIRIGMDLIKYGTAIFDAAQANDGERLDVLLSKELRSTVIVRVGEARARDIALRKRREAEAASEIVDPWANDDGWQGPES